jgi:hypothetical protein
VAVTTLHPSAEHSPPLSECHTAAPWPCSEIIHPVTLSPPLLPIGMAVDPQPACDGSRISDRGGTGKKVSAKTLMGVGVLPSVQIILSLPDSSSTSVSAFHSSPGGSSTKCLQSSVLLSFLLSNTIPNVHSLITLLFLRPRHLATQVL